MSDTWNIVQKGDTKLVWKDFDETNINEIKEMESEVNCEPYFCKVTNSVVFKTTSKNLRMIKGPEYSQLELISRYLTTESKLYDLLES
jgi:hypothetical protein